MRIGIGYDIHKLEKDRKLILGNITIPHTKGLLGHSDADVLLHAISDAMLGAAGLSDIGIHFPDDDPKYKGISSADILTKVKTLIHKRGYDINNIDSVIIAQEPRLSPFIEEMKNNISKILDIPSSHINIKSTTNEGMDSIGKGEAIASHAVVLIKDM